jgi:uncharacterized protein YutD
VADEEAKNVAEDKEKKAEEPKLYHDLAKVAIEGDTVVINDRHYQVLVNVKDALDEELLAQKYDPYLDQYDLLVGDVASGHLRFKGFYQTSQRVKIDQKSTTVADYLTEYVNPGSPYFILALTDKNQAKEKALRRKRPRRNKRGGGNRRKKNKARKARKK